MSKNTILRGTLLLTGATFFSKFIGMIYTIPFESLVGAAGGKLYGLAYGPYSIFISLSTVGIPLAVSKFVAKYNSLGDYRTSRKMYKVALRFMLFTGLLAFLTMFFGSDLLAKLYIPSNAQGITEADVAMVFKMISFALLVIPAMSITRGFFQGHESMGPTAISQVVEQIVRIVFLLGSVFVIIHFIDDTYITLAVGFATFSAFIGAIASAIILFLYWRKRKPHLDRAMNQQVKTYDFKTSTLFKELFRYAGPFVMVGLAIPLYQQIDSITFERTLLSIGYESSAFIDNALSNIILYGHKLVMIPITLATGLSLATLPTLTKTFVDRNKTQLFAQINQSLQIIMLLIVPAVVGMSILSYEAWGAFYGVGKYIDLNGSLLRWYAPVALFFGLFTVTSSILQAINQQRYAVVSLTAGLVLKGLLNIPLMHLFGPQGAVIATLFASVLTVILNVIRIKQSIGFSLRQLMKRTMLIVIFTTITGLAVALMKWILNFWITYNDGRIENVVILAITVTIGAGIYLTLSYASTLLERILGGRIRIVDKLFRRKSV
ncbi:putative cell division protein YtgP [Paraliobacillus sp. PM-2]|uniref:putative polysaccharide biosynthesis protein n=1 Tax=Paraliobacillus sp. PM-2 TaxID=1462524 RepID=UPI00061BB9AE|nr:polysaccharide biosynthesis protein [Paraliobacillus sp. PM-2]CQR48183.1 putative cell division protein YtgP [Paraliobacillus sp. PM-2]